MDPDGLVDLPLPPEKDSEGNLQIKGVALKRQHAGQYVYCLVSLVIKQIIHAGSVLAPVSQMKESASSSRFPPAYEPAIKDCYRKKKEEKLKHLPALRQPPQMDSPCCRLSCFPRSLPS